MDSTAIRTWLCFINPTTLTGITAFATFLAAVAAWLSARATKKAAEAQLFSIHFAEYGKPEMSHSLRVLRAWKDDMGKEFTGIWKKARVAGEKRALDVDQARRQVKFYFMSPLRMWEAKFVSKRFLRKISAVSGINILYEIVEPLEFALNPDYDRSAFEKLRKLCGQVGSSESILPVPPEPHSKDN